MMNSNAYIGCMTKSPKKHVVVGGGIVGLVSAFAALSRGSVTVFDPQAGSGATHAAAGMLSPGAELVAGEFHALSDALVALDEWPAFLKLFSDSEELFFPGAGSLLLGYSRGDSEEIRRLTALAAQSTLHCETVTRAERPNYFEEISPRFEHGVYFANDAFVNVDSLMHSLIGQLQSQGVTFMSETVERIESGSSAVVHSASGSYEFDSGLLCTGALTGLLNPAASSTLRSVRGVTLRLQRRVHVTPRMVRGVIDGRSIYIVDRPNGEVIVGASADESTERYVDTLAVAELLRMALILCPSLDTAEFLEARSGLRPVGPDGQPFLERLNQYWGWHTGYFRHGVLMAPLAYRRASEFWND
jgi:glycine oxidase